MKACRVMRLLSQFLRRFHVQDRRSGGRIALICSPVSPLEAILQRVGAELVRVDEVEGGTQIRWEGDGGRPQVVGISQLDAADLWVVVAGDGIGSKTADRLWSAGDFGYYYLSLDDIEALVSSLRGRLGGRRVVSESAKMLSARGRKRTDNWLQDVDDIYDAVRAYRGQLESLRFVVKDDQDAPLSEVFIDRYGRANIYGSEIPDSAWEAFTEEIVLAIARMVREKIEYLEGRSARKFGIAPRAISLTFETPLTWEDSVEDCVSRILRRSGAYTMSTLHQNPYFHGIVIDHQYVSSVDVLVVGTNEIQLSPGFHCKASAFQRMMDALEWGLGAFSVSDVDDGEGALTLEEVFGGR